LNAHLVLDDDGTNPKLLLKSSHDIGIAVDTPQGLLVPVVRDVQSKSIMSLAAEITRLSTLAKEGRLSVSDFQGATFTVSNIGSIGGAAVSPVIVGPQVGILGVGRSRVVAGFEGEGKEERIVRKEEVVLSWAADHRVLDGATVARCAEMVGEWVENVDVMAVQLK
jgi:2-oxoisovalerate dehydrogenase E2 component (dihydrolipoyl transacylase)